MIVSNNKEITQIYRDDSLVEYIYKGDRPIYDCMIDYVLNDDGTCYVNRAGPTYVVRQENIEYLYIPNKICKNSRIDKNSRIYKVTKVGTRGGDYNKFQTLKKALIGTPTDESGNMAIVDYGFENRTSLEEVVITDSVISIGFGAFRGCNKIAKMTLPPCPSRFDLIFRNQDDTSTGEWVPPSLKTVTVHSNGKIFNGLPGSFFYKCSYIETVNIDIKNLESIGDNTFEGCSNLKKITIPDSVTSIGEDAFKGCDNLKYNEYDNGYYLGNSNNQYVALIKAKNTRISSCTINKSTKIIYSKAFYGCSDLTDVRIGNSVTSIGSSAFWGCGRLTSIKIPDSVTSIDNFTFEYCEGLTDVTIGKSVTSIGAEAFHGCSGLKSITIPNSVTSMGDRAFSSCSGLTNVTIGNSVTSIGDYAFSECSGLISVTIGNSVTSIGQRAFWYCSKLTDVTIPNGVTSIGDYAFYNCTGLTSVTIPDSITSIGEDAFYGCNNLEYNESDNGYYLVNSNNSCVALIKAKNTSISSCIINENTKVIYTNAFWKCSRLTDITIPNSVTSIGLRTFGYCRGLTSVIIGNSVTSIGEAAFWECSGLTSVTIGNSVTSIGEDTFYNCSALTSVTIPNSVTSMGDRVFKNCDRLKNIIMLPSNPPTLGSDAIPSNVTTITVPAGCGNTYKTAAGWSAYADKIVEATA